MSNKPKTHKIAEQLQNEAHKAYLKTLSEGHETNYQDFFNTWVYYKLAEIIIKQENLIKQLTISKN